VAKEHNKKMCSENFDAVAEQQHPTNHEKAGYE